MLWGPREGPREHKQRPSLEDHEMLWNTTEDSDNGTCTLEGDRGTDLFEVKSGVKQG